MILAKKIQRRLDWYRVRFQVNNPVVGRAVELLGDKVRMDGLTYSVASPQITRGHKSTLAFGLHEMEERKLVSRWLPDNIPIIEFGGGLGVVSCLANRKLLDPSRHIVVEANPAMVALLKQNRDLNGCQFEIVNKALAYDSCTVDLNLDGDFVGTSVKGISERTVSVATTSASDLMAEFECAGIICDIEGSEAELITRELPVLRNRIRFLMAEMHPAILGKRAVSNLLDDMVNLGFVLKEQNGDSVFFSR